MFLRLDLPYLDRTAERGRLSAWLKEPGDDIAPGDAICEVVAEALTKLEIPRSAKLLTRLNRTEVKTTTREVPKPITWLVIAREPGTLERTSLKEGDAVAVGDSMAVIAVAPFTDGESPEIDSLSGFRVYGEKASDANEEGA